MGSHAARSTFD